MASRVAPSKTAFRTSARAREVEPVKNARHLAWIRTLPSAVSGHEGCVAAHLNFADRRYGKPERGKGKKADDRWVLPLTPYEHTDGPDAQHRTGKEKAWWDARGIDATTLANDLWRVSGDTETALVILQEALRGRAKHQRATQPRA
ncbi:conserved hypothetical protein [Mesorhizobium plurifarium]|uniref:DUF968 domain-containing protein n=1 Tax=Mesorhizobium plurifarium TaxID=69974 RepID=A0A090EG19_MESPL|nr:conserved hypothetical protein [Mesorhizobium plurifarium]